MRLGARHSVGAAAGERGQHLEPVLDQPSADGRAHHAGRDHCDHGIMVIAPIHSNPAWPESCCHVCALGKALGARAVMPVLGNPEHFGFASLKRPPDAAAALIRTYTVTDNLDRRPPPSRARQPHAGERRRARCLRPCQHAPSGDPGRYLLSRSRSPALIEPATFSSSRSIPSRSQPPTAQLYAERVIHGCIYQARPDVMAVVPSPCSARHAVLHYRSAPHSR